MERSQSTAIDQTIDLEDAGVADKSSLYSWMHEFLGWSAIPEKKPTCQLLLELNLV